MPEILQLFLEILAVNSSGSSNHGVEAVELHISIKETETSEAIGKMYKSVILCQASPSRNVRMYSSTTAPKTYINLKTLIKQAQNAVPHIPHDLRLIILQYGSALLNGDAHQNIFLYFHLLAQNFLW